MATEFLRVRIDARTRAWLDKWAHAAGMDRSSLVRLILEGLRTQCGPIDRILEAIRELAEQRRAGD